MLEPSMDNHIHCLFYLHNTNGSKISASKLYDKFLKFLGCMWRKEAVACRNYLGRIYLELRLKFTIYNKTKSLIMSKYIFTQQKGGTSASLWMFAKIWRDNEIPKIKIDSV